MRERAQRPGREGREGGRDKARDGLVHKDHPVAQAGGHRKPLDSERWSRARAWDTAGAERGHTLGLSRACLKPRAELEPRLEPRLRFGAGLETRLEPSESRAEPMLELCL